MIKSIDTQYTQHYDSIKTTKTQTLKKLELKNQNIKKKKKNKTQTKTITKYKTKRKKRILIVIVMQTFHAFVLMLRKVNFNESISTKNT